MIPVNLKDAYSLIPVHLTSRKYLRAMLANLVYQYQVLSFGLLPAPQVFIRLFTLVSIWAHIQGTRFLRYLDEWLILADSRETLLLQWDKLLQLCPDPDELREVKSKASTKYGIPRDEYQDQLPARQWQQLIGHLTSLEKLVPHSRLCLMSLQWRLKSHWAQQEDPPTMLVSISPDQQRDLEWWVFDTNVFRGIDLLSLPLDLMLFTDASKEGWGGGAYLSLLTASGIWSESERPCHINLVEIRAAFLALKTFKQLLSGHAVVLMSDNTTVVFHINKQGGSFSQPLCQLSVEILKWMEENSVTLSACFILGNIIILADNLSRKSQIVGSEWSLDQQIANKVLTLCGPPMIDLFAMCLNQKLPIYCSPVLDPQAVWHDTFQNKWDNLDCLCFLPSA
ncbi:uncharacterized protein [Palaemon carinicauda]|uniref:uncharacterized protein n=1 Tax=Palaemon carinicauda TaxID=392227 RepID=UPI0035B612A9